MQTTIGAFSGGGSRAQARAANMRAVEPAPDLPSAGRGNLYLFLQVVGSGGGHSALYRQALNAAQQAYYELGEDVESALRQAVRNAHYVLTKANEALPDAEWRGGMTCAAVLDRELVLAQAGPALALVSHPTVVEEFPADQTPAGPSLGGALRPDPRLFRTTLEPGAILLLAHSDWLKQVPVEALAVAAAADVVPHAVDYLGQLAGEAELSALLVGFAESTGEPMAEQPRPASVEPSVAFPVIKPRPAEERPQPAATGRPQSGAAQPERQPQTGGWLARLFGKKAQPAAAPTAPAPARPATEAWPTASKPASASAPSRSPLLLITALIGVPVVVAALVLGLLWFRTRMAEQQFAEVLTGAATALAEAESLPDEAAARLRLNGAREFLDKARVMRPADAELNKLQIQYGDILARLDRVASLYGFALLWDLREAGRRPDRVAVGGDSVFVLDRGRQEVDRFVLSSGRESVTPAEPPAVVRKGQQVAEAAVSDLLDIFWFEAVGSQRSQLLVMDVAGGLVGYDSQFGVVRQALASKDKWGLAQLAATYAGNLYVVDTKNNQIWRYRPTAKGYEGAPEPYFNAGAPVDLAGVQALAIDGNIWLLYADGRLLKFFMGEQKPFELRGLPDAMRGPVAIAAPVDGDRIYIGDSGNGRILEFDKEGQFQRQFRPPQGAALQGMTHLTLDAIGSRFYILTVDKLFRADLPRPAPAASGAGTPTPTPTPTPAR
jgi:hypothetical protein